MIIRFFLSGLFVKAIASLDDFLSRIPLIADITKIGFPDFIHKNAQMLKE